MACCATGRRSVHRRRAADTRELNGSSGNMRSPRTTHILPGCCVHFSIARSESTPCWLVNSAHARRMVSARAERTGRAQQAERVPAASARSELAQRVLEPLDVGRRVAGERRRPQERHFGAVMAGDVRDLLGVGRHDHRLEHAALDRRRDRVRERRMSAQRSHILAGNALAALTSRNQRNSRWRSCCSHCYVLSSRFVFGFGFGS